MATRTISKTQTQVVAPPQRRLLPLFHELARFHTTESHLECFPAVWALCLTSQPLTRLLYLLPATCISMTLLHGTFCVLNDIIDASIDSQVSRTRTRPIPSGRLSRAEAFLCFSLLLITTVAVTTVLLGVDALVASAPIYMIATVYPLCKRVMWWPQLVLAPAVGWAAFVGWAAGGGGSMHGVVPLFLAVCVWTVYFDTCYGLQDREDDRKANVGSLALLCGAWVRVFLGVLGVGVVAGLAWAAWLAGASWWYWGAGVGVWAASIPWQLMQIKVDDCASGGRMFRWNIQFGMYFSAVSIVEALVMGA